MAKFAIALCTLLVACCITTSKSENPITATIEKFSEWMQEAEQKISDARSEMINTTLSFINNIDNMTQSLIDEHNKKLAELSEGAVGDVATCLSSSGDFTELIRTVASSVISCANTTLANVWADYQTVKTSVQELVELINNAKESDSASASQVIEIAQKIIVVTARGGKFASSVASLPNNLEACVTTTPVQTLASEAKKYYIEFKECIANLDSTATE